MKKYIKSLVDEKRAGLGGFDVESKSPEEVQQEEQQVLEA